MSRNGFIYGLQCTCHDSGVRYIGKSLNSKPSARLQSHRYNARRGQDLPVYRWMRKHGVENIVSVVLGTADSPEEVCLLEIRLIAEMRTHVSDGGLNCTRGGDGSLGWNQSPESIAKANESRAKTRGYVGRKPRALKPWKNPELKKYHLSGGPTLGAANNKTKLTVEQVTTIKSLLCDRVKQQVIAETYGVSQGNISVIAKSVTWKYIPWPQSPLPPCRSHSDRLTNESNIPTCTLGDQIP